MATSNNDLIAACMANLQEQTSTVETEADWLESQREAWRNHSGQDEMSIRDLPKSNTANGPSVCSHLEEAMGTKEKENRRKRLAKRMRKSKRVP